MAEVSKATLVLQGSTRGLRRAMSKAQRTMRSAASGIKRRARRMGRAVAAAMAAAGGAMVAFAAKSTQMAARFEKNMTKVTTLVGLSRERVRGMRDDVLSLAAETGQAPTKLAKALFRLTSGGIRGAEALTSLRKAAQSARIGMGEVNELARIATSSVQAFGKQGENMSTVLNTLFATIREGNVRVERLQSAFGFVQSIAADVGVTIQDLGAFFAVTSRTMGDTNKAARALRQFLVRLQDPTKDMKKAFTAAGTSVAEVRRQIKDQGLPRTLVNLARAAEENGVAFAKIVQSSRALPALLTAARGSAEDFLTISERMSESQSQFEKAIEETSKTLSDQVERLKATGEAAKIAFGERFAPAVEKLVNKVRRNMPQITATIATVMADTIKAIRSVLNFVDGAVKEMGIGGAVGFLLLGPKGAALGGLVGKIISEQEARLKRIANQMPGVDFEIGPAAQKRLRQERLQSRLQDIQRLQQQVRNAEDPRMFADRLTAAGVDPSQSKKTIISRLSDEADTLNEKINRLSREIVKLFETGKATPTGQKGPLGQMAEEAKLLEKRLRKIAQQGGISVGRFFGGRGGGGGFQVSVPGVPLGGGMTPAQRQRQRRFKSMQRSIQRGGIVDAEQMAEQLGIDLGAAKGEGRDFASVLQGELIPAFSQLSSMAGDTASKIMNMATQLASAIAKILQSSMTFGSPAGLATLGAGLISGFAGFFQHGGTIPKGKIGIVGESGPEPVAGPATVFPDEESVAAAAGGGGVSIDPRNFRPVTRWALAKDPEWQAAMDATLEENQRQGGKMAEVQNPR